MIWIRTIRLSADGKLVARCSTLGDNLRTVLGEPGVAPLGLGCRFVGAVPPLPRRATVCRPSGTDARELNLTVNQEIGCALGN